MKNDTLFYDGVFGGTKSGVGYLSVWDGQWSMVCFWVSFCIVAMKRKLHANATKVFSGFFGYILPDFQGNLLKVAMFKYYIHKCYQYKTGF
jgi:hypothetical protein